MRILLVDDDKDFTESLGELIELKGHEPVLAYNGLEALNIFKQNNIDLILIDIRMPGLNGIQTVKKIRGLNPSVPVVMMTAYSDQGITDELLQENVFGILDKPVQIQHVLNIITNVNNYKNILLLDDDKDFADSLAENLALNGFRVYTAYNSKEAIQLAKSEQIQFLLLDLKINGKTGLDIWKEFRNNGIDVPTLFITGFMDMFSDQLKKIGPHGRYEILNKPVETYTVINKINYMAFASGF